MDNADRIKAWREKRTAGILPTDPQATALALAYSRSAALVGEPAVSVRAILSLALDCLAAFPNADLGQRRSLFARMTEGVQAGAKERGLSEATTDYWSRRVTLVVRSIEADVRKGTDVLAEGYAPEGLADADAKLRARFRSMAGRERSQWLREQRRRATHEDVAHTIDLPPADAADLTQLRSMLALLHATQRRTGGGQVERILTILPLFFLRLRVIQADSRIALLWTFMGPATMATILSSVLLINGLSFILGMDAPSFSLCGIVTWYMFRIIVFRSSESYFGGRPFLNLEPVVPLVMATITSILYFIIYLGILFLLVTIGHLIGVVSLPNDVLGVIGAVAGVATVAWAMGLIFAGIASRWEFFLRLAPPIERFLQLFSSVFFVSEQFPQIYRKYILWWPLSHGFQLLRSAYFAQYKSVDASLPYFLLGIVLFAVAGLIADRLARPNVHPW
jgi:capsular polysaccharide transport system permease protein